MLLKGLRNLLVECVGGQGVMFSEKEDWVGLKHLVVTSEIKTPVVKVAIDTDCRIIHRLYFLSIHQIHYSTWSGCISLAETELCRKTFSGFISDPIQRCRVGRRHYFWIQWYADLCAVVNPEFYSVYSRILNAIINSLSSYLLIQ